MTFHYVLENRIIIPNFTKEIPKMNDDLSLCFRKSNYNTEFHKRNSKDDL